MNFKSTTLERCAQCWYRPVIGATDAPSSIATKDQPWPEPGTATVTPNRGGLSTALRGKQHSALGLFGRGTERARGHLTADDADQNDWIEVWGTRIGRMIGMLAVAAFLVWLVIYLSAGA